MGVKSSYSLSFMYQYFSLDNGPILEESRYPIDHASETPCELIPNGPLLDYLRAPYQYQQIPAEIDASWASYRESEVKENWNRLVEVAREERVGEERGNED